MNEKISKFTKKQLDKLVKQYMHVWSINWKQQTHDDTVTVTQTLPEKDWYATEYHCDEVDN